MELRCIGSKSRVLGFQRSQCKGFYRKYCLDTRSKFPVQDRCISYGHPDVKKQSFAIKALEFPSIAERLERFSDWNKARRAIALCLRLKLRLLGKKQYHSNGKYESPTANELYAADSEIIRITQNSAFQTDLKSIASLPPSNSDHNIAKDRKTKLRKLTLLRQLDAFVDTDGLLRVGGRLQNAEIQHHLKHPIILPRNHHVSHLIIKHYHSQNGHQGRGFTIGEIRNHRLQFRSSTPHQELCDL